MKNSVARVLRKFASLKGTVSYRRMKKAWNKLPWNKRFIQKQLILTELKKITNH